MRARETEIAKRKKKFHKMSFNFPYLVSYDIGDYSAARPEADIIPATCTRTLRDETRSCGPLIVFTNSQQSLGRRLPANTKARCYF